MDGDGVVGAREYFLAKRFDLDGDGKLNDQERKNCIAALENGFEDNFRWNLEAAGVTRGKRLIQIRGKIIDAEDFGPISETYPAHPLSKHKPNVSSLPELRARRKSELMYFLYFFHYKRENLRKQREQWQARNPASMPMKFVQSEFLIENPKHLSIKEIAEERRIQARQQNGLSPITRDVRDIDFIKPSMKYVSEPKIHTRTEFIENLRKSNVFFIICKMKKDERFIKIWR